MTLLTLLYVVIYSGGSTVLIKGSGQRYIKRCEAATQPLVLVQFYSRDRTPTSPSDACIEASLYIATRR